MRNLDKSDAIIDLKQKEKLPLEVLKLDVTNDKSVKEAIGKIVNEQETIDVLVNNARYALVGALEELSIQEFKEQFETNLFGVIRVKVAGGHCITTNSDSYRQEEKEREYEI
jgi:NAD(P)-dependent dehydrogenase (short-subunit alcohol dehydrogenase family)